VSLEKRSNDMFPESRQQERLGLQLLKNGRALTAREKEGLVKVIIDKKTSLILGVHIAGADASNLISEACLALRLRAKVEDIESTIHPHPTLAEAFVEAVSASVGRSIHSIVKRQQ